ncbi:helix-turn-helix domain-containing protein [Gloeocapsopsis dulcis]|uniref:helix-turn-helix domain-containing protein n=1 Tax=Gloeocapsopsis dulcis TaxID=2859516 RepID=UPI000CF6A840|nr:helix-turn-helix domain-containing protein [Gloeocapsopsis dulcis]WNN92105.1 helix-turn-helix domain-containing protein [Gloeocapsopsis dulcis]
MADSCGMTNNRVRKALQLLAAAGLIESIERPGRTTLYRPKPQSEWVVPERLSELRSENLRARVPRVEQSFQEKALTPTQNNTPGKNNTPTQSNRGVLSELIPPPLLNSRDEGIPNESIPNKVSYSPLTPHSVSVSEGVEKAERVGTTSQTQLLTEHLTGLVQSTLVPIFRSLVEETKVLLAQAVHPSSTSSSVRCKTSSATFFVALIPWEELARLVNEPIKSLRINPNLTAALEQHPNNIEDAFGYFKQAMATWKNKPGLGLFISAVKKGLKPTPTRPGGGWKEWADEATRRRLMSYSHSSNGDIAIYFVNGVQRLWSEVRSLSWSEIEAIAQTIYLESNAA